MKRLFDVLIAVAALIFTVPILIFFGFLVWMQDFKSPIFLGERVGKEFSIFQMIKLRSMIVGADKTQVDSTSKHDNRITTVGRLIRKFKLDEFSQLINVLRGDMSIVGPRPNIAREVDLYTDIERKLLTVLPGITDFASIVFADEAEILEGHPDANIAYNQLIRPWKSKLGLFYVEKKSLIMDLTIVLLTVLNFFARKKALRGVSYVLSKNGADKDLVEVVLRQKSLEPAIPPGAHAIVTSRY
jgi:lipopolysaccharide/colanic/teichoic acid biosynthesis glycosyltransferase